MMKNNMALNLPILFQCNKCFKITDLYSSPNKVQVIYSICRLYLNIRLNSNSKMLSSSIMKAAVGKRQKLSKTILFNNM